MAGPSATPTRRGALIVVEGLDRAGKSSQCEMLRDSLSRQGRAVKYIRFPAIYAAHRTKTTILFTSSSPRTGGKVAKSIEDDITNGTTVIVDRYSYSGVVYSAAKANPTLSLDWAWQPEIGLPRPDISAKRGGFGAERYENEAMQTRVRELFRTIFEKQQDVSIIDAGKSIDEVAQEIQGAVAGCIARLDATSALRKLEPLKN
ncbi:Thymidylate kinase [Penicillium expansum]|nr:Thymidylate kinase [Penicillium expansum]